MLQRMLAAVNLLYEVARQSARADAHDACCMSVQGILQNCLAAAHAEHGCAAAQVLGGVRLTLQIGSAGRKQVDGQDVHPERGCGDHAREKERDAGQAGEELRPEASCAPAHTRTGSRSRTGWAARVRPAGQALPSFTGNDRQPVGIPQAATHS